MGVSFAADPTAQGFFAPTRFEADIYDCEVVEGKIPTDLAGTFYRVGGEWFYPPLYPDDSPFNADGYISMFQFRNGVANFRGRWIKTDRWLAQQKAQRQLFGYYRNALTDDPAAKGIDRGIANTNVYVHAGKLYALKEDALPMEMHPDTLDTLGYDDFRGRYKSPTFTAHPKTDPVTGEMITYGYEAEGDASNAIWIYWIDKTGRVTREVKIRAPYVSMVHDIAITEKHILFPVYAMTTSKERLAARKLHWGWEPGKESWVGVLPRDGEAKDVRWFKGPERGFIHTFNASVAKNGVISMEAPVSDGNPFPFFPPFDPGKSRTTVRTYTFDMNSKDDSFGEEVLDNARTGALGRIDERYFGMPHRYGYMGVNDPTKPVNEARAGNIRGRVTNCYARYDFTNGDVKTWHAGDVHSLQENVFIPRRPDAPEGDGYLIGVASNYAERCSELVLVDAVKMETVCRLRMPFRLSNQIHGQWAPAGQLPSKPVQPGRPRR